MACELFAGEENSVGFHLCFSAGLFVQITDNLEQRCYKDLRNENFGSVKVVLCIYRKFLSLCKEQM